MCRILLAHNPNPLPTPLYGVAINELTRTCDSVQSAYYVRPSPSITRSEETASSPPTFQYVDVGTPNYAPAPDHQNIAFCLRSDANPPPPTRGIFIPAFSEGSIDESMEAPDDTPLALTPAGEVDSIALEFHVRQSFFVFD